MCMYTYIYIYIYTCRNIDIQIHPKQETAFPKQPIDSCSVKTVDREAQDHLRNVKTVKRFTANIYIYIHICIYVYVYMHIYTYVYIYIYVYMKVM